MGVAAITTPAAPGALLAQPGALPKLPKPSTPEASGAPVGLCRPRADWAPDVVSTGAPALPAGDDGPLISCTSAAAPADAAAAAPSGDGVAATEAMAEAQESQGVVVPERGLYGEIFGGGGGLRTALRSPRGC